MKKKIKHFWTWLTDCKELGSIPITKYIVWLILLSAFLMFMFRVICINPLIDENRKNFSNIEDRLSGIDDRIHNIGQAILLK